MIDKRDTMVPQGAVFAQRVDTLRAIAAAATARRRAVAAAREQADYARSEDGGRAIAVSAPVSADTLATGERGAALLQWYRSYRGERAKARAAKLAALHRANVVACQARLAASQARLAKLLAPESVTHESWCMERVAVRAAAEARGDWVDINHVFGTYSLGPRGWQPRELTREELDARPALPFPTYETRTPRPPRGQAIDAVKV